MKTPMQQIKELLDNALWDHPNVHELIVNWIDDNMAELLLTEREMIEDAFIEGNGKNNYPFVEWDPFPKESAENYYNEKFNTKE